MTLKGCTDIVLTDVRTGRVESHHDENMVTNALRDLVSMDPAGMRFLSSMQSNFKMVPICPNAAGGVLLFPKKVTESVDGYLPPADQWPVGYASNSADSTGDPLRGSFNSNESYATANGYRLVWDFGTSDANGDVSCICLTTSQGGAAYLGSTFDSGSGLTSISSVSESGSLASSIFDKVVGWQDGKIYSAWVTSSYNSSKTYSYVLHVATASRLFKSLPLSQGTNLPTDWSESTYSLSYTSSQQKTWCCCMDGSTVFALAVDDQASSTVHVCSVESSKLTESTLAVKDASLCSGTSGFNYAIVAGGALHVTKSDGLALYKVPMSDTTSVTEIALPVTVGNNAYTCLRQPFGNGIVTGGGWRSYTDPNNEFVLTTDGTVTRVAGFDQNVRFISPVGPYEASCNSTNSYLSVIDPVLLTINNLGSPVTKTADKTMKVIYTLSKATS
ncbi:MAG: hypothetical protein WAY93_05715 [Atopobiaceae bacterium]|jgi:hypothetical protein|nr:hypothetical protein [Atopobiaceae bacterium]